MKETEIAFDVDLRESSNFELLKSKIALIKKGKRMLVYVRDIIILDKIKELKDIKILSVLKKNEVDWVIAIMRL